MKIIKLLEMEMEIDRKALQTEIKKWRNKILLELSLRFPLTQKFAFGRSVMIEGIPILISVQMLMIWEYLAPEISEMNGFLKANIVKLILKDSISIYLTSFQLWL
jgi:hypothetical protein